MFLAQVQGNVVASQKADRMAGAKLLIVEPFTLDYDRSELKPTGRAFVVIDTLGAGVGEHVLITMGSSARLTEATRDMPIDAVIVGIVDTVTLSGKAIYRDKSQAE
jgi:ethanolamine utilization protein EutN